MRDASRPGPSNELESIYRSAPVGLSFIDRDLRYVRVNQVVADENGLSIEEIVGKTYRELSPESADNAEPFLRGLMERGETLRNHEARSSPPCDPGVEHIYLLNCDPVRNEAGEVIGLMSAFLDITDRKRAEQLARQAGERARAQLVELEALYRNLPVGLCRLDTELRVVSANPRFAEAAGNVPHALYGADASEILPARLARHVIPAVRRVLRTARPSPDVRVRGVLPHRPSRENAWLLRCHPIPAGEGGVGVAGVIVVLEDITLLVKQEEEIASVRDRLAEAQRVSKVGSWEWDIVQDRMWWSDELFGILGEDRASAIPSYDRFFEHVHLEDRGELRDQLDATLTSHEPCWVPFRVVREDGGERRVLTAVRLERSSDSLPSRLLGTCQDVTEMGAVAATPASPAPAKARRQRTSR